MRPTDRATRLALLLACLSGAAVHAGAADWKERLFGTSTAEAPATADRTVWRIGEFTTVQRVPREAGSAANQHPVQVPTEVLRQALASVQVDVAGRPEALFGQAELIDIVEPLRQALSVAGPGDDVQLLSTDRRDRGFLAPKLGLTARLFVQDGQLNLIVRDARLDFYSKYLGTNGNSVPNFTYGSRTTAGSAKLQSAGASAKRADWLAIPLGAQSAASAVPAAAPAAIAAPLGAAPAVAPAAVPLPVAPTAAGVPAAAAAVVAPQRVRDAAYMEEQELRLKTLKRLRDSGLIGEDEYQQKRREVLQAL